MLRRVLPCLLLAVGAAASAQEIDPARRQQAFPTAPAPPAAAVVNEESPEGRRRVPEPVVRQPEQRVATPAAPAGERRVLTPPIQAPAIRRGDARQPAASAGVMTAPEPPARYQKNLPKPTARRFQDKVAEARPIGTINVPRADNRRVLSDINRYGFQRNEPPPAVRAGEGETGASDSAPPSAAVPPPAP